MKIYFNDLLVEKNRIIDDQWVKGNSGNKLEVYFEDNILESSAVNVRAVIEWSDGSTTNELVLNKSIKRDFAYLNLPILKTDGEVKFTLKIYSNDSLQQTTLFSRKVYNSINASDEIHITSSEYESLLEAIESAGVDVDDQVKENTDNIETLLEAYEKGGLKYFDKVFAEDEIIDLFNINGNGKYSIKSALYGDEIVIVNVENQYVSRFNGNATLTYDFEKDEWVKQTGSIESEGNTDFELVKNKITRWESLANDNQYPSASLVKSGLNSKLDKEQGNDNAYKVAVTNRFGNVYFEEKLPKVNMPTIEADDLPEIPKDKLPEITVDMLPSGAGIIAEIAEELRADGGNITGNEIKSKLTTLDDMTATIECKHVVEITGNTGDEHNLAVEDQQVLIKKIQGQSIFKDGEFKHSQCNLISTGRNLWDEEWETGYINDNGVLESNALTIRSKNYINALPKTTYYFRKNTNNYLNGIKVLYYDNSFNFISFEGFYGNNTFTTPNNCSYIKFATYATVTYYDNDICINVSDVNFNGTYEPYKEEIFVVNQELKAFDFIENEKKTFDTLEIDLSNSSLEWKYANDNNGKRFTCESLKNVITGSENNTKGYLLCSKYETGTYINVYYNQIDKVIAVNPSGTIAIYDSSYNDLASFKASLNGVKLLYKANYSNVEYVDLPAGYSVYKGGYQIQDGEVPYILTKEYSMSLKAQILANIEIDKEQQEQLNELSNKLKETNDSFEVILNEVEYNSEKIEGLVEDVVNQNIYNENTFVKKTDITNQNEYGVFNVVLPTSSHIEINLATYKYFKGIVANTKGERVFVNGEALNDEGNRFTFTDYLKNGSTLEYINGCLLVRREDETYIERILPSTNKRIAIVYDGATSGQDNGFSIYWKGEK